MTENPLHTSLSKESVPSYGDNEDIPSPHTLANEALHAGMMERKLRDGRDGLAAACSDKSVHMTEINSSEIFVTNTGKRLRMSHLTTEFEGYVKTLNNEAEHQLITIWNKISSTNDASVHEDDSNRNQEKNIFEKANDAVEATKTLIQIELESIYQKGLDAFHRSDTLNRELSQVKELCETRGKEVLRLQSSEAESRQLVTNLLRAVEMSKVDIREASRTAQLETRLRGELAVLRAERNEALGSCAEAIRKTNLLDEEIRLLKEKMSRLIQEKIKIERDSRAALSLAKSIDHHVAADADFYKRKVTELNDVVQVKNAIISEQSQQIEEFRRQIDRSLSQNRLLQIRADSNLYGSTSSKSVKHVSR